MLRFLTLLLAALSLAGCAALTAVPPSPGSVADQTILDERAAIAVEQGYRAGALLLETAVDAGLVRGAAARTAAVVERRAWGAVQAVRAAYRTGNAADYATALGEARSALAALFSTTTSTASGEPNR